MVDIKEFIQENKQKFLFFAGKGGVGKSTMSCATALWASKQGKKTLIVTTDAAPNLSDIFEKEIGNKITSITSNLSAIEINPKDSAEEYRKKAGTYFKTIFTGKKLDAVLEELKSPCVEEVATLNEFLSYTQRDDFDLVIFDTAPSGHTLRLLELPGSWSMELSKEGFTCMGPNDSLQEDRKNYESAVKTLTDSSLSSFIFVITPDFMSINETSRSVTLLKGLGMEVQTIIVNRILPEDANEGTLVSKIKAQDRFVDKIKQEFDGKQILELKFLENEIKGITKLNAVSQNLFENKEIEKNADKIESIEIPNYPFNNELLKKLEPIDGTRFVFFLGKGGVGKSTIASITALHQSKQGYKVLLITTDPADHLKIIFKTIPTDKPVSISKNLFLANIDAKVAHKEYKERKLNQIIQKLKNSKLHLNLELTQKKIEEELNSPCAEEVAYFEKFMSYFEIQDYDIIMFDTAPTGHTLRMLELPSEWNDYAEISAGISNSENKYKKNIDIMKNSKKTSFVYITLAEYTPMMEAYRSYEELNKYIGSEVAFIIVNNIIYDKTNNQFINQRKNQQNQYLKKIEELFKKPLVTMPLLNFEPIGIDKLEIAEKLFFR